MNSPGFIKGFCGLFLLIGSAFVLWGIAGIAMSVRDGMQASGVEEAKFEGYRATEVSKRRSIHEKQASPLFHYARFRWKGRSYEDPTPQFVRWYRSGDAVQVLVPETEGHAPRLADWRARFLFHLVLVFFGLLCITPPAAFLMVFSPAELAAATAEGSGPSRGLSHVLDAVPPQVLTLLKGMAILLGGAFLLGGGIALWSEYGPELVFGKNREMLDALSAKDGEKALALAKAGEGVHAENEYRQTALILAIDGGHMEVAKALLAAGADPNVESKMLQVPLTMAIREQHTELVGPLLEKGARIDAGPEGHLFSAVARKNREITSLLLARKPDLTARLEGKWTLIDLAIFQGDGKMIELLHQAGAPRGLPEACEWVAGNDQKRIQAEVKAPDAREKLDVRCGKRSLREFADHLKRRAIARLLKRGGL